MYLAKIWDVPLEMRKNDNTPQSRDCGVTSLSFPYLCPDVYVPM